MNAVLFFAQLRAHRAVLLLWAGVMAILAWVVVQATGTVVGGDALSLVLGSAPEAARAFFGDMTGLTAVDAYITLKMLLMLPLILVFYGVLGALGIFAREVDAGTADTLLVLPVQRSTIARSRFLAVTVGLFALHLVVGAVLVAGLKSLGFGGSFAGYARALAIGFLVTVAFSAAAFLISVGARSYAAALRDAVVLILAAYAADALLRARGAPVAVRALTLFGAYDAPGLVRGSAPLLGDGLFLAAVGLVCLAVASGRFEKREVTR